MQIDGSWGNDMVASAAVSEAVAVPKAVKVEGIAGAKGGGLEQTAERIAAATASGVILQVQHCTCSRICNLRKALEGSHAQPVMFSRQGGKTVVHHLDR